MKKIGFWFATLCLGILVKAQQEVSLEKKNQITIPFTCNTQVDQYMADYQTLVKIVEWASDYNNSKIKQEVNTQYTTFIQKYSNINKEIALLEPEKQKFVAGFISAKSTELTNLVRKINQ